MIPGTVLVFAVFLSSFVICWLMRAYALRCNVLDIPNDRSSHTSPTPRGGGVAIVVSGLASLVALLLLSKMAYSLVLAFGGAGLLVAAVGFLDDHGHVPPRRRVAVHGIAAIWAWCFLIGIPSAFQLLAAEWVFNIFWLVSLVWIVNLYNFMDGVDAIAGAETMFVATAAAFFSLGNGSADIALMAVILIAATAGFLVWNIPPARIFLGDVGSGFLGMMIGVMALAGITSGAVNVWVWVILLGAFLVDSTLTVARRMMRGARWYEAHCSHAYQHAARKYRSHARVTLAVTGINVLWLLPWAIAADRWPDMGYAFAAIAYFPLIWLVVRFDAGRDEKKTLSEGIAI